MGDLIAEDDSGDESETGAIAPVDLIWYCEDSQGRRKLSTCFPWST